MGTEKMESELSRVFPQAKIGSDITIATSAIFKQPDQNFDLVGVLGIDTMLNRVDFRSGEKTFATLLVLLGLTDKRIVIESYSPKSNCFQALFKNDPDIFYEEELKERKHLGYPPFKHMILVKLRGSSQEKVKNTSEGLFKKLSACVLPKDVKIISLNKPQEAKLRGNFYWQILINAVHVEKAVQFIKNNLKDFRHSGIIVTMDVDPL